MKEFLVSKFTSRKFWLTVGTAIVLIANQQWTELTALILGYCGINTASAYVKGGGTTYITTEKAMSQNDVTDKDVILTGDELAKQ